MFGRRLINTQQGGGCTTDTLQILGDTSCVATYRLNGDATDLSGNYNGTATSVTYVTGQFGDAGSFNGSSSKIVVQSPISPSTDTTNFNYSFWLSTAGFGSGSQFVVGENDNGAPIWIGIYYDSTNNYTLSFLRRYGGTYYIFNRSDAFELTPDVFYHISLNYYYSNKTFDVYVNGIFLGNYTTDGTTGPESSSTEEAIGQYNTNPSYSYLSWNGKIDQIRRFDRAITAEEVTTLYNEVAC